MLRIAKSQGKVRFVSYFSMIEFWIKVMQDELNHIIRGLIKNKITVLEYVEIEK